MPAKNGKLFVCGWCGSDYYAAKHKWPTTRFCSRPCSMSYIGAHRHAPPGGTQAWREYKQAYDKEYRLKNLDALHGKSRLRIGTSEYKAARKERTSNYRCSPGGRARVILTSTRIRAERKHISFSLSYEWLFERFERGVCEATGLPLDLAPRLPGQASPWGPSIDRTNPSLGYTPDNCKVVCWAYNTAKGTWSHADVVKMATALTVTK